MKVQTNFITLYTVHKSQGEDRKPTTSTFGILVFVPPCGNDSKAFRTLVTPNPTLVAKYPHSCSTLKDNAIQIPRF